MLITAAIAYIHCCVSCICSTQVMSCTSLMCFVYVPKPLLYHHNGTFILRCTPTTSTFSAALTNFNVQCDTVNSRCCNKSRGQSISITTCHTPALEPARAPLCLYQTYILRTALFTVCHTSILKYIIYCHDMLLPKPVKHRFVLERGNMYCCKTTRNIVSRNVCFFQMFQFADQ